MLSAKARRKPILAAFSECSQRNLVQTRSACTHKHKVESNSVQPGTKLRFATKARYLAVHLQKHLLCKILRIGYVASTSETQ
jgi:hypothetical protein